MKTALIIIFNHKYEKNIPILDRIYKDRFSYIYYLMPFYQGTDPRVICVYENSYFFQGYIAQGINQIYDPSFDHYFFIADDLILNPNINENNYADWFLVDEKTCYLPEIKEFHRLSSYWRWVKEAFEFDIKRKGVEAARELPPAKEALELFKKHGYDFQPLKFNQIYRFKLSNLYYRRFSQYIPLFTWIKLRLKFIGIHDFKLPYPICGSYADAFIINSASIELFSHYTGVFSALELFAELAIPTSMILSSERIVTEKNLSRKGRALWNKEDFQELLVYNNNLLKLLNEFPDSYLYYHPIKLSKWDASEI